MKTQILQLDPHDDIVSARDKIGWAQTGRILLVWPTRGRILTRRLDLILLHRQSEALGAQLAIVTTDPLIRINARITGILVFKNIQKAQESRWRRGNRIKIRMTRDILIQKKSRWLDLVGIESHVRSHQLKYQSLSIRLIFFTLGILAFLILAATFIPNADVTLSPSTKVQEINLIVQASTSTNQVNLAGNIPIHQVSVVVEGRDELTPTGMTLVPENYAVGEVRFTNLTDQVISIPAGTIVSGDNTTIRFSTQHSRILLAGVGQTLNESIIALVPGALGNLSANSINNIYSALGVNLTVTNPRPITGGNDRPNLAPTQIDQKQLWNNLFVQLRTSAQSEIQSILKPGDVLLTTSPNLSRTIAETYDPNDLQPTNQLSLQLRLEFQALIISGEDLDSLVTSIQNANLPAGYYPVPDSLIIKHLTTPTLDGNSAEWQLSASRILKARLIGSSASNLALGLSIDHAKERLFSNLPLSRPPEISLNPGWWPILPMLPFRITINTQG